MRRPVLDRFNDLWALHPPTGCWLWTGATDRYGYGMMTAYDPKRVRSAHRVAHELFIGDIASGLDVLHSCDRLFQRGDLSNRRCVNPSHLKQGTNVENVSDMVGLSRQARGIECHSARMTDGTVALARTMFAAGVARSELAERFSVSWRTIDRAIRGETWRHVQNDPPTKSSQSPGPQSPAP